MPFPDSEYPSILRGKDKRESQRLLAAAPELLAALKRLLQCYEGYPSGQYHGNEVIANCKLAIAKAEGKSE